MGVVLLIVPVVVRVDVDDAVLSLVLFLVAFVFAVSTVELCKQTSELGEP